MGHPRWSRGSSSPSGRRAYRCSHFSGRDSVSFKRRGGSERACHGARGPILGLLSLRDTIIGISLPSIRNNNYGGACEESSWQEDSPFLRDSQSPSSSRAHDRPVVLRRWLRRGLQHSWRTASRKRSGGDNASLTDNRDGRPGQGLEELQQTHAEKGAKNRPRRHLL